jgi:hypothetical protein
MAERKKGPREVAKIPWDLDELVPSDATLVSAIVYAARKVLATTTLAGAIMAEDATIQLNADPKVGALLTVEPGSLTAEETFKITSVSGAIPPFTCGITPTAEQSHSSGASVEYYPGVNAPFMVDDTPTPDGTIITPEIKEGADSYTYMLSAIGTTNGGEIVEDELEVDVVELAATSTVTKQPSETRKIAVDFSPYTDKYNTTLVSAIAFIARQTSVGTTLAAGASAGAVSLSLTVHPGVGALLTVNPAGPNQEKLLVSAVSGSAPGPYTCTVSPLQFAHSNGEATNYYPGVSPRVLVSTSADVTTPEAVFTARRGQAAQTYHAVVLGTLADGQVRQKSFTLTMPELTS